MNSLRKRVALIYGGRGFEHDISVRSAEGIKAIIDRDRFEILSILIARDGAWYTANEGETASITFPVRLGDECGFLTRDGIIKVACAIPCLHGDYGEDGVVQGLLSAAGIPYIGQDVYASAVTQDKIYTKLCAEHLGIPTAPFADSPVTTG